MTWWASGPFQNFYKSNLHFIIWIKIWIQNSNSASQKVSSGMLFYSSKYRVRPIKYMTSGPQKVSFRPWNTIFIGIQFQKQRSSTAQYAKFGRLPFLNRIMEPPEQKKGQNNVMSCHCSLGGSVLIFLWAGLDQTRQQEAEDRNILLFLSHSG